MITINLTEAKISKVKKVIEKTLRDEYNAKQSIASPINLNPEYDMVTMVTAQRARIGAIDILNALGIGVDLDFANSTCELWKISTEEAIG